MTLITNNINEILHLIQVVQHRGITGKTVLYHVLRTVRSATVTSSVERVGDVMLDTSDKNVMNVSDAVDV